MARLAQSNRAAVKWFQQNRWVGIFLTVFGICSLAALFFLLRARIGFEEAFSHFNEAAAEHRRLRGLDPFPNDANYNKTEAYLGTYSAALEKVKEQLKARVLSITPMAPNEFQSRLRRAMILTAEKARANRVRLPDNFHLGFDEFTAALPDTASAPLLGQQLTQVELLMNILIDARVDAITVLKRAGLPAAATTTAVARPVPPGRETVTVSETGYSPKLFERGVIDLTFTSSPSVARKVLNQIAGSSQQLCIIRRLYVRNEKERGPPREESAGGASPPETAATTGAPQAAPSSAIEFIVGNEHIEVSAKIEMVRFTF